jgi:uncharacterized repeat protein (TIGR03803 family)
MSEAVDPGPARLKASPRVGTTNEGGLGAGVVYKIDTVGQYTVLYTFTGGADGGSPYAGVILDPAGNLYGTNVNYGDGGGGVVFELSPSGNYTVLYSFTTQGPDGSEPFAGVVRDSAGNLYGTTQTGGDDACGEGQGCGVVYELSASGQLAVLYTFTGAADGGDPYAGVMLGRAGNLYGTTSAGGAAGGGVLYKLTLP